MAEREKARGGGCETFGTSDLLLEFKLSYQFGPVVSVGVAIGIEQCDNDKRQRRLVITSESPYMAAESERPRLDVPALRCLQPG